MNPWTKQLHGEREPTQLSAGRAAKQCGQCGQWFSLPRCHAPRHQSCSIECGRARAGAAKAARKRPCETCGAPFTPRAYQIQQGGGRYCSQQCNKSYHKALTTPEAQAKSKATWRANLASGAIKILSGPDHPRWRGGLTATLARQDPEARRAQRRKYLAENPHKGREWFNNRRCRAGGKRLPKGYLAKLYDLQRGKCAICRTALGANYHTDHIVPLAKGGKHHKHNVQLLCGPCNVRKSAKDPIEFMQSRGFLL